MRSAVAVISLALSFLIISGNGGAAAQNHIVLIDSVLWVKPDVREIGPREFEGRDDFHTVKFHPRSKLQKIGESAFAWCPNLRSVELPPSLRDISHRAFAYCPALEAVNIPSGTKHIGCGAFAYCRSLEAVDLPGSVTELESYAFLDCMALRRVTLPANPSLLGETIFSGCRSLEQISEPSVEVPEFDCASTLFDSLEQQMYTKCRLVVPEHSKDKYANHPSWGLFKEIL